MHLKPRSKPAGPNTVHYGVLSGLKSRSRRPSAGDFSSEVLLDRRDFMVVLDAYGCKSPSSGAVSTSSSPEYSSTSFRGVWIAVKRMSSGIGVTPGVISSGIGRPSISHRCRSNSSSSGLMWSQISLFGSGSFSCLRSMCFR